MNVLVDANIFLAVIMNEPEKKAIIRSTKQAELISPEILPYEIGNALSAMLKRKRINSKNVVDLFSIYNYSEARQNFALILNTALKEEVIITRKDESKFKLISINNDELKSPFDVKGINCKIVRLK